MRGRYYTDVCKTTSSLWNSWDPAVPDVSHARGKRNADAVLRLQNFIPAGMSNHFSFRDNEMLLSNFQEREHISSASHLVLG